MAADTQPLPRFLTPTRIYILILVDIYSSGRAAINSTTALLSLISTYTLEASDASFADHDPQRIPGLSLPSSSFQNTLSPLQSSFPGRSLYDLLLADVWTFTSADHLEILFSSLCRRIATPEAPQTPNPAEKPFAAFSRASPIGKFIRHSAVELTRLQFASLQSLWESFSAFRQPTFARWASRNPETAAQLGPQHQTAADARAMAGLSTNTAFADHPAQLPETIASASDVDALLDYQITYLQRTGSRVPAELRRRLEDLARHAPQGHFVAFFDAWRAGQYMGAVEALHRYFDYTLSAATGGGGTQAAKAHYQYALLHLSVLHTEFGHLEEAVESLEESIATARENQDTPCLTFALSWLRHLRASNPGVTSSAGLWSDSSDDATSRDELQFLKTKAREQRNWTLLSGTLLGQAGQGAQDISAALANSLQSSHLNVEHDLRSIVPSQQLLQSSLYSRLGQSTLSTQYVDTVTHIHKPHANLGDKVRTASLSAFSLAWTGRYEKALALLKEIVPEVQGVLEERKRLLAMASLVHLKRAVHRSDFQAAERNLSDLLALNHAREPGIQLETQTLRVELELKRHNLPKALTLVRTQLNLHHSSDPTARLRLLLLKAHTHLSASRPAKALTLTLRAAAVAHAQLLTPILHRALAALACILNDLCAFAAARALLAAALPAALEAGDAYTIATLYEALADSLVGLAGEDEAGRARALGEGMGCLERALEGYGRTEDLDGRLRCLVKKARLLGFGGDEASRRECEGMFAAAVEEAEKRWEDAR